MRPGSTGARIAPALLPGLDVELDSDALLAGGLLQVGKNEVVMWKPRWSAFYRTPPDDHLRDLGVDTVVAGCYFPNCPRATVFDASERDYRIVVTPGRNMPGHAGPSGRCRGARGVRHVDRGRAP